MLGELTMRPTKLKLAVGSLLLIAAAAIPWLIERQSEIKLRQKIDFLQKQLDQQAAEDDLPSNLLAHAADSPLPNDQFRELLKLRSEVGLLRRQTNELLKLQAENRQLRPDHASGKSQQQPNLAAGDLVTVESLAFAGYATPEAAFQSTLSADAKGDFKTFLEGFTPERRLDEEKDIRGKSESELAARAAEQATHFATAKVQILASKLVSDDEAKLVVFLPEEKNELSTFTMKRIAGEWKIALDKH